MKYKCERCNELQANLDNMFTIAIGTAKYIEELEGQRTVFKRQFAIEAEARATLQIELNKKNK